MLSALYLLLRLLFSPCAIFNVLDASVQCGLPAVDCLGALMV